MNDRVPRVSIGLPVYNGENYIRQAIDSVLNQTYQDWELIVCDNCSEDGTQEIMEAYAAQDTRIRYIQNASNIGGSENHNRTVQLARGEYYKFFAHDDILLPTFLERCVEELDRRPEVVNCHTLTMIIDEHGQDVKPNPWHLRTDSENPRTRFRDAVWVPHHSFQIYGLMRREILLKTPLIRSYPSADQVLLAELALHGPFHEVPEFLFRCRRHARQSVAITPEHLKGRKMRSKWLTRKGVPLYTFSAPHAKKTLNFHMWRVVREYAAAPWRTPASFSNRLWCTANIAAYAVMNTHKLVRDLLIAVDQFWQQSRRASGEATSAVGAAR